MLADLLNYPYDSNMILRKKKALRRELLFCEREMTDCRIALLGGSTTAEIRDILELFLLKLGIRPTFYESQYNRFFEEAVFECAALDSFNPQLVVIHSGIVNIGVYPEYTDSEEDVAGKIGRTVEKYETIWTRLFEKYHCEVIQNNFELPHHRILGNLDAVDYRGRVNFVLHLNSAFSLAARKKAGLHINDVHYLSSMIGMREWFDASYWFMYKYALSYTAVPLYCNNVASMVGAILGKSKKVLVLDLDNTLWGGVIGDDGVGGIKLGRDTPQGEAYSEFQAYLKCLKDRGVLLSVSSKNEMTTVREGLQHPDSVLKMDDFAAIKATWESKDTGIREIAAEVNVGSDSMVFIDDNPAERELVSGTMPEVAVPNMGSDVLFFSQIIDRAGYFETVHLVKDDVNRHEYYHQNRRRAQNAGAFERYDDYLVSLEMVAEIGDFSNETIERVTQLTNKTNQFNVTTCRYTLEQMVEMIGNPGYIGLYGKLQDKFGDNGLASVIAGRVDEHRDMHIDLWVMSCRVFNREMEFAMFDELVFRCIERGVGSIYGYFIPTQKNAIAADVYPRLGFAMIDTTQTGSTVWQFKPTSMYQRLTDKIEVKRKLYGKR